MGGFLEYLSLNWDHVLELAIGHAIVVAISLAIDVVIGVSLGVLVFRRERRRDGPPFRSAGSGGSDGALRVPAPRCQSGRMGRSHGPHLLHFVRAGAALRPR